MRSPTLPSVKFYPFVLLLALFCTSIAVVTLPAGAEDPWWREGTVEEVPVTAPAVRAVNRFRSTQWSGALDTSAEQSVFRLNYSLRTESYSLNLGAGGTHRNGAFIPAIGLSYEVKPWTISAGWSPERNLIRLQWAPSDVGYFVEAFDLGREVGVGVSGLRVWDSMTVTAAYRLPSQSLHITLAPLSSGWAMTASVAAGQVTVSLRWSPPASVVEEVMKP